MFINNSIDTGAVKNAYINDIKKKYSKIEQEHEIYVIRGNSVTFFATKFFSNMINIAQ